MIISPLRVLIVEDEPAITALLHLQLEGADIVTFSVSDVPQALAVIAEHHPDVVLLDLLLPGPDGFHLLEILAGRPHAPPVVVYSALVDGDTVDRCIELGAVRYLRKPATPDELAGSLHFAAGRVPPGASCRSPRPLRRAATRSR